MSGFSMPRYLYNKIIPDHQKNDISKIKKRYDWVKYKDITIDELKKLYSNDVKLFWSVVKHLTFVGCEFKGKLNKFNFSNTNGEGYIIVLDNNSINVPLDFDYLYAFLKLQLQPYQVFDKYDLHLVKLNHVINSHMNINEVIVFLKEEGFLVTKLSSIGSFDNGLVTHINNNVEKKSIEKDLIFNVGSRKYKINFINGETSLESEKIPDTKISRFLKAEGYTKINDLPSDLTFLLDIPHIAERSVEKFFMSINNEVNITSIDKINNEDISTRKQFKYYNETIPITSKEMMRTIDKEQFGPQVSELFRKKGFQYIGDLPFDLMLFLRDLGYKKVDSLKISEQIFGNFSIEYLENLFYDSIQQIVNKEKPDYIKKRNWDILLLRISGKTLEEIGLIFELTRERVRQIVNRSLNKMFGRYEKYFKYLKYEIEPYKVLNFYDFFCQREVSVNRVALVVMSIYNLPFNIFDNYLTTLDREKYEIEKKNFQSNLTNDYDETHLFSREEIEKYISEYYTYNNNLSIEFITKELIENVFETNENGYFKFKKKLSKARMCQIVFEKEFSNGLEIYKQIDLFIKKLNEYFPGEFNDDSSRAIIANLTRGENVILLWKVGFFKHISAVSPSVNKKTLRPIKEWLSSCLSENAKQINTNVAFTKFSSDLDSLEIDSDHALFSLLKIYFPDSFNYSRSPTLVKLGHNRLKKINVIENYVKEKGGYISNIEINKYFIDTLGWTKTMFDQNITESEYLLKTHNGFVHEGTLDLEEDDIREIYLYAKKKINQLKTSYSIETIFDERKSTLLQMNINDSKILYQLLEKYYKDEFDFHRYPHIHPFGKYTSEQVSAVGQFETFFLENEDYYLRQELHEEFVEVRGWPISTYNMAYSKNKRRILQILPNEFAHIQHIGWNEEKENQLVEVLNEFFTKNKDKVFFHIKKDIMINDNLISEFPEINYSFIDWTETLLVSILERSNSFIMLGTKRFAILKKDNNYGIKNIYDYIAYLLRNKYEGYVKLSDLHKYLYSIDICGGNSVPVSYLTSVDVELEYELVNDEVLLKELMVKR